MINFSVSIVHTTTYFIFSVVIGFLKLLHKAPFSIFTLLFYLNDFLHCTALKFDGLLVFYLFVLFFCKMFDWTVLLYFPQNPTQGAIRILNSTGVGKGKGMFEIFFKVLNKAKIVMPIQLIPTFCV